MAAKKKPKTEDTKTIVTRGEKTLSDCEYWKKRSGQLEDSLDKANAIIEDLNKTAEAHYATIQAQRHHIIQLEKNIECERHRSTRCLDVAEEASTAAGMIGRVTHKLYDTLEDIDARLRRADTDKEKKNGR
jgi:hypothetical protein